MDQTWTVAFCVGLSFFSGASSVRLLIGKCDGIIQWHDTETQVTKVIVNDSLVRPLNYHFSKGYIYYSGYNFIKRRSVDPSIKDLKVIEKGQIVSGIAVDWINNNIYWSIGDDAELVKADLDGNHNISIITKSMLNLMEAVSNIANLYTIEVDPYARKLFMIAGNDSNWFEGILVKSDLEGRDLTVVTRNKNKIITTFSIDRPKQILYVVTKIYKLILSCKYNGEVIEEFSVCPKISWIYPFTTFRQNMYMAYSFGDNDGRTLHAQPLSSVKCPNVEAGKLVKHAAICDIKVYEVDVQQPLNVYNSYQRNKQRFSNWDNCSLVSSEWERIKCLKWGCSGTTVGNRSTSSVELLIGRSSGIIQLHNPGTQETKVIVKDSIVRSLDYHYSEGYIYYSGDGIQRRSFDPKINDLKEISNDRNVYGIAVDWINNNLYWTRSYDVELVKANLDGNEQKTIIINSFLDQLDGLDSINFLYDIEVDPYERTLFMIAGSEGLNFMGSLVKSDLEGRNLIVITRKKYKYIAAFTIDRPLKILYIVNVGHQGIYSCRYNGEVIEELSVCPKMWWIYPFATFRQNMYMAYGYEENGNNNIFHVGHLASVKCPIDSLESDNTILGIKVYGVDVQQPLNVYNSYQRIKQRIGNWDKCS